MIRILLCCAGGMSTSLLVTKMEQAAQEYLIDMRDYGKMDGKAVLTFALNKLQEV